ncbi:amidohydrolase, partial [Pedobacter sp.]|uniref:amidohydrolase n=1 Tax=Pedobacter sp. TaxID=1411316 RepID=UPI003D7F73EC
MKKSKKKIILLSLIVMVLIVSAFVTYKYLNSRQKADIVIYGNIYTGTEGEKTEEALAIKGDKFIYIGSVDGVKQYIDDKTEVIKQNGGLILPGFTDTHTHVTPSFAVAKYQIDLSRATSVDEYLTIIKDFVNKHPNDEMYIGRGWNYILFKDGIPTKDILDQILPDIPIYIKSNDGHACWVNSKMIELIGVTKDTKDPIGGKVIKDIDGNPVGCFRDVAMDLYVKPHLVPYTVDQYKELIQEAQKFYAELGYSSYVEVFVEADNTNYNIFKAYEELDKEGKLKLRVQGAWNVSNEENATDKVSKLIEYKDESKGGMFELTDIKIFMDGVAETGTAYFSEPYADDTTNYGADRWP